LGFCSSFLFLKNLQPSNHLKIRKLSFQSTLSPQLQQAVQNLSLVYLTLAQTLNPLMVRGAHKMAKDSGRPFLSSTIVLNTEGIQGIFLIKS